MNFASWFVAMLVVVAIAGCAGPSAPASESERLAAGPTGTPAISIPAEEAEEPIVMNVPASAEPVVMAARRDLASRVGVDLESIRVLGFEAVDWPDSSLGCPEPGKMYLQVITPGYRVVLLAAGQEYEYHADRGKRVVFCSTILGSPAVRKMRLEELRGVVEQARNDLAQRLGVELAAISVTEALPTSQLERPAPCPEADQLAGTGDEYQVILETGGATYVYHARGETVLLCSQ